MLHGMDNMDRSYIFYVRIGKFTHLKQSKISLLTDNQWGIVRLTVQHDMIVSVVLMPYPGNHLRQPSADNHSFEQRPLTM